MSLPSDAAVFLGVVPLLFLIGLELQPSRLRVLRRAVSGLGGARVAITGALVAATGVAPGLRAVFRAIAAAHAHGIFTAAANEQRDFQTANEEMSADIIPHQDHDAVPAMRGRM